MISISDYVELYTHSSSSKKLLLRHEGKTYSWIKDRINVSAIPYLLDSNCYYKYIVAAQLGLEPEPDKESKKLMANGVAGHTSVGQSMGEVTEVADLEELLRNCLRTDGNIYSVLEFPLTYDYQGVIFRGRADNLRIKDEGILLLDEWKFTKNGRIKEAHEVQARVYAYLAGKIFGQDRVKYRIQVWKQSDYTRGELRLLAEKKNGFPSPSNSVAYLYHPRENPAVESYLDRVLQVFSGETNCLPYPDSVNCGFCNAKYYCPYYESSKMTIGS